MGMTTELLSSDNVHSQFPWIDIKGLDNVTLESLYTIVSRQSQEGSLMLISEGSPEGPWVFTLPIEFADLLADLKEKDIATVVAEWIKTEEMQSGGDLTAIVTERLNDIIELASKAKNQDKGLLMLWAL